MYKIKKNEKTFEKAIFTKDDKQVSKWWYKLKCDDLLNNKSNFYIAKRKGDKFSAIFSIDDKDTPISEWWYDIINILIYKYDKESVYDNLILTKQIYIVQRAVDKKYNIFSLNNKDYPLEKWTKQFIEIINLNNKDYPLEKWTKQFIEIINLFK